MAWLCGRFGKKHTHTHLSNYSVSGSQSKGDRQHGLADGHRQGEMGWQARVVGLMQHTHTPDSSGSGSQSKGDRERWPGCVLSLGACTDTPRGREG